MNDLKTVAKIVKAVLEEDKQSRNSDSRLYMMVLQYIDCRDNTRLRYMPVYAFLREMGDMNVPSFETVRRTRQKVQALYPELCPSERVKGLRMVNETEYRQFSRSESV